ncbi:hypothetical protein KKF91_08550, partial [Myxococcota bacterium]|nr:hypothetical protein [Myxococcota bacterium]
GDIPEGPVSLDLGPLAPPPSWIITAELPRLHVGLYEALAAELTWLEKGEPRVERQTLLLESTAEAAELRAVRADVIAARHLAQATAWPEEILMALRRADGRQIIRTLDASLQHFLAFEAFDKASEIEGLRVRFLRRGMLRFQDINRLRRLLASVTTPPL